MMAMEAAVSEKRRWNAERGTAARPSLRATDRSRTTTERGDPHLIEKHAGRAFDRDIGGAGMLILLQIDSGKYWSKIAPAPANGRRDCSRTRLSADQPKHVKVADFQSAKIGESRIDRQYGGKPDRQENSLIETTDKAKGQRKKRQRKRSLRADDYQQRRAARGSQSRS